PGIALLRRSHGLDLLHERLDLFFGRPAALSGAALLRCARAGRLPLSRPFRIHFQNAREVPGHRSRRLHSVPQADRRRIAETGTGGGGPRVSTPDREAVELFLQEVSARREDMERLYIAAHTLKGTSASYGFPRFSEVAGKLAHVFQYALHAP